MKTSFFASQTFLRTLLAITGAGFLGFAIWSIHLMNGFLEKGLEEPIESLWTAGVCITPAGVAILSILLPAKALEWKKNLFVNLLVFAAMISVLAGIAVIYVQKDINHLPDRMNNKARLEAERLHKLQAGESSQP